MSEIGAKTEPCGELSLLKHLPNLLTGLRLVLAPAAAWAAWQYWAAIDGAADVRTFWAWWTAGLFVAAALTDLFDGWAARALKAESKLGRILDPIADKVLVGLPLIVLAVQVLETGYPLWPVIAASAAVIIGRDLLITVLRLISPDGEGVRVSPLAKWKTAVELTVVGAAMVAPAIHEQLAPQDRASGPETTMIGVWLAFLVLAAALSAWTGAAYLRPAGSART